MENSWFASNVFVIGLASILAFSLLIFLLKLIFKEFVKPQLAHNFVMYRVPGRKGEPGYNVTKLFIQNQEDIAIEGNVKIEIPIYKNSWYVKNDKGKSSVSFIHGPLDEGNQPKISFHNDYTLIEKKNIRPLTTWLLVLRTKNGFAENVRLSIKQEDDENLYNLNPTNGDSNKSQRIDVFRRKRGRYSLFITATLVYILTILIYVANNNSLLKFFEDSGWNYKIILLLLLPFVMVCLFYFFIKSVSKANTIPIMQGYIDETNNKTTTSKTVDNSDSWNCYI